MKGKTVREKQDANRKVESRVELGNECRTDQGTPTVNKRLSLWFLPSFSFPIMSTFNGFSECQLPVCNQRSQAVCGWQTLEGEREVERLGRRGAQGEKKQRRRWVYAPGRRSFLMEVIKFNAALRKLIIFSQAEPTGSKASTGVCVWCSPLCISKHCCICVCVCVQLSGAFKTLKTWPHH